MSFQHDKLVEMAIDIQREWYIRSRDGMMELEWKLESLLEEQGHNEEYIEKFKKETDWEDILKFLNKHGEI